MAVKTKKPKVKQPKLPGMEPETIKEVDDAAANYFETMTERVALSKEEDEKKTALIEKMKEHGMDRYETSDGLIITVTQKSGVKAKKKKPGSVDEDGEEADEE